MVTASLSAEPTAGFSHIHVLYAWLQTHRDLAVAALFGRAGSGEALASHQHKLVWASMAVCVYRSGAERAACAQRGVVFLFLFIFFVTGGTKHSLVVNRMWVYIIRGGLIKKICWFFFLHSVQKMTNNPPTPTEAKLVSGSFTARKRLRDRPNKIDLLFLIILHVVYCEHKT